MPNKHYVFLAAVLHGFGMMAYPSSNVALSRCVGAAEQGTVLSMSSGIRSLTQGISPVLFNGLFAYFTYKDAVMYFPQAPFVLAALCMAIAIFFSLRLSRRHNRSARITLAAAAHADAAKANAEPQSRRARLESDSESAKLQAAASAELDADDDSIQFDESPFVGQTNTLQA